MRRVSPILGLLCSLVLFVAACGGGGDQQAASEPDPTTRTTEAPKAAKKVPEPGQTLSTDTEYVTTAFKPAFTFRVIDEGWEVVGPEITDIMDIAQPEPFVGISFNNPQKVYDPRRPTEQSVMPEPKDWVSWFQNHPHLNTGKPTPVTIGGVSRVQFDSELASAPRKYPEYCRPNPCVPLWPLSDGGSFDAFLGDPSRTTILNVAGETVIIDVVVFAQLDKAEELFPRTQKVLNTVEWKGA